ncbi:MAG: MarC family protein [Nitrospirae bacterium]|nr:MarC family protein [Nitrospirota bacterium]MCL5236509.1 MarC family protein [Nitrospirota bacterium]
MDIFHAFLLSIIPVMVAIDAPGVLPIYITMTEDMAAHEKKRIARQSVLTAFLITTIFIFLGAAAFKALGILVEDFMIAGGILLLVISINDMLHTGTVRMSVSTTLGVVPLGTPLLAGPATMTTSLVLVGNYGYFPVILSLVLNLLLAWLIFDRADIIIKRIGINGTRGVARVALLLLAAIAVKMIRMGVMALIKG